MAISIVLLVLALPLVVVSGILSVAVIGKLPDSRGDFFPLSMVLTFALFFAAMHARGEYLCLLNSDAVVPENWLEPLLARFDDPRVGAVVPLYVFPDGSLQEANRETAGPREDSPRPGRKMASPRRRRFSSGCRARSGRRTPSWPCRGTSRRTSRCCRS